MSKAPLKQETGTNGIPSGQAKNFGFMRNMTPRFLLLTIVGVFVGSHMIKQRIANTKEILIKNAEEFAQQASKPVKPKSSENKVNVMCPKAKGDLDSCNEKLASCVSTQKQFEGADVEFTKLIEDCAKSNQDNEEMNVQLEKEIKQMRKTLKTLQTKP